MGWVRGLGVRRGWRGRGLGLALLQHTFGAFYARGRSTVGLGVDAQSPTGATRLYQRAGMRVTEEYETYQKILSIPGPSPAHYSGS
jgi:ribosomal protein S18 acetylase RimI-like enzyme